MIQRLAQQNDVLGQVVHLGGPLGDDEEPPGVRDVDHHIAALIAVGGKLGGIVQRIAVVEHEGCCIGRGGLILPAARKGEDGGRQGFQKIAAFHGVKPLSLLRRQLPYRGEPLAKRVTFQFCQGLSSIGEVASRSDDGEV